MNTRPATPIGVHATVNNGRSRGLGTCAILAVLGATVAAWGCDRGNSNGGEARTPMPPAAYAEALDSANAAQVQRNAQIDRGTSSDRSTVIHVVEQVVESLSAYAQSLNELSPPPDLASKHRDMVNATTKLVESEQKVVDYLRSSGGIDVESLPLFEKNNDRIGEFVRACHNLNRAGYICGPLVQHQGT